MGLLFPLSSHTLVLAPSLIAHTMGRISQYELDLDLALLNTMEVFMMSIQFLTMLPILADTARNRELLDPARFREKFRRDRKFQNHEFLGDKLASFVIVFVIYRLFGDDYAPGFYHVSSMVIAPISNDASANNVPHRPCLRP